MSRKHFISEKKSFTTKNYRNLEEKAVRAVPRWQLQPSGLDGWPCRPWRWLALGPSECVSNSSLV